MAAADWSNLNKDMVEVIVQKLDKCTDYVRLRAACLGWRSSISEIPPKQLQQRRLPYLLIPPNSLSFASPHFALLSSLDLDGEVVDQLQLPLQQGGGGGDDFTFRGFSKGWLVAVEKTTPYIHLINPVTGDQRLLPPMNTFPDVFRYFPQRFGEEFVIHSKPADQVKVYTYSEMYRFFIEKVVLSSPPTESNCIAMAIYGEFMELAYCRYGDKGWTNVPRGTIYHDIIFSKDKFYVVDVSGSLEVFDVSGLDSSPAFILRIPPPPPPPPPPSIRGAMRVYLVLVKSCSSTSSRHPHLLLVARFINWLSDTLIGSGYELDKDLYETVNIKVFKFNLDSINSSNPGNWSKSMKTFGNHVLFLGCNESISFPSHTFPGCQGDHVYFTDNYFDGHYEDTKTGGYDNGVFKFQDKTVKRLQGYKPAQQFLWPPPIWVMHHNP